MFIPPLTALRNRYLLLSDAFLLLLSVGLAYTLRFEGLDWGPDHFQTALAYTLLSLPLRLSIFFWFGFYRRLWRHAGVLELEQILEGTVFSGTVCFILGAVVLPWSGLTPVRVPYSVLLLDAMLTTAFVALPRMMMRIRARHRRFVTADQVRRVIICGAGASGGMIARELLTHPQLGLVPVGFVDDDPQKLHHRLQNLPILGSLASIPEVARRHRVDEVIIAMPSAPGAVIRNVVRSAAEAHLKTRTVPGLTDLLTGRLRVTALREVNIEDLLRREPVRTDLAQVKGLAAGETVLVTGAGGSIGSEICRQIARLGPRRLVMVGHGENSIFDVHQELAERHPEVQISTVIVDIRDRDRLASVFERFDPYSVFHAAAHKHVPLMEANVPEAVTNNVLGTRNVVELAAARRVEHLVLISTDKAVRPTSVMGATKRTAEQIVQQVAETTGRNFVSVRFGNVLGSRGSVVPTFLRQIAAGGPVTVTHPEMRRYFMTIPESVQLVLQAGALGRGGEVFVLDMGEPVKVADLAADLIRLSQHDEGKDIEIRFTGTRPGEKLFEELFFSAENAAPTDHPKVLRAKNASLRSGVMEGVEELITAAQEGWADEDLKALLRKLVPDYDPSLAGVPTKPSSGELEKGGRGEGGKEEASE